jgi:hypothetical protein
MVGALVVKIKERRGVLLGLSAPTGHAITVISQPQAYRNRESSLAPYRRAFAALGKLVPPRADADSDDPDGSAH